MNSAYHFLPHYVYATLEHCAECASRSYKPMIPLTAVLRMVTNVLVNLLHRFVCGIEILLGFVAVLEPCVVVAIHGSSRQQRLLTLQLRWPPTPTLNLLATRYFQYMVLFLQSPIISPGSSAHGKPQGLRLFARKSSHKPAKFHSSRSRLHPRKSRQSSLGCQQHQPTYNITLFPQPNFIDPTTPRLASLR
jgi:hypothetical protein